MKKPTLLMAGLAMVLILAVPTAAQVVQDPTVNPENVPNGQYEPAPEPPRDLPIEQISSDTYSDLYPESPRMLLASSAATLSNAIGAEVPDSGDGAYLAVYWGPQPSSGYSVAVESARLEGDRVMVGLALKEPALGEVVQTAFTYPYAVSVVRGPDLLGRDFSFVDQNGLRFGWPVYRVTG